MKDRVRTDLYCHECSKNFSAVLDYNLDGNHEIHCPWCGHIHYRLIKGGVVTSDRYSSDQEKHIVGKRSVWKSAVQPIMTTTASHFIRESFLNRSDVQGN
jgi:DNA-directed RNA polymerase subunit RPC12/RpoP